MVILELTESEAAFLQTIFDSWGPDPRKGDYLPLSQKRVARALESKLTDARVAAITEKRGEG